MAQVYAERMRRGGQPVECLGYVHTYLDETLPELAVRVERVPAYRRDGVKVFLSPATWYILGADTGVIDWYYRVAPDLPAGEHRLDSPEVRIAVARCDGLLPPEPEFVDDDDPDTWADAFSVSF